MTRADYRPTTLRWARARLRSGVVLAPVELWPTCDPVLAPLRRRVARQAWTWRRYGWPA